jgi:putative membrane protein
MMWPMSGQYGMWNPAMMVMMLVFWALVIVGLVLLVRWAIESGRGGGAPTSGESALDILQKRYARGEVSREDYEQMRRDLEGRK